MEKYYLHSEENPAHFEVRSCDINTTALKKFRELLEKRPPKTELPKQIGSSGTMQFGFKLDFGSFRDIQRHRAVIQLMPLVTTMHGFGRWYLGQLSDELREEALSLLKEQERAIEELNVAPEIAQYYTAMGYNLPCVMTGDLPALVYLVELRGTRFVHPTLMIRARQMADVLLERFGDAGLVLHMDEEPGQFDIRRGKHDITQRE